MRFASVLLDEEPAAVVIDGETAIPVAGVAGLGAQTPLEILREPSLVDGAAMALSEVTLRPVIPRPGALSLRTLVNGGLVQEIGGAVRLENRFVTEPPL